MKSHGIAATSLMAFILGLTAACGPANAAGGSATPIPIVADLGGVKAEGRLEPIRFVELAPVITGLVSDVAVTEGEVVNAGDLLVNLDSASGQTLETARTTAAVELGSAYEALRVATRLLDEYPLPRAFAGMTAEQAARTWLQELDAARLAFEPYEGTSRKQLKPSSVLSPWVYPSLP